VLCTAPPINKQTASEYSLKSHALRKARLARLLAESKELAELKAAIAELPTTTLATNEAMRLWKLRRQIEARMDDCTDAKELASLTAAHERLFKTWCVLTDTKSPGVNKGSKRQRPAEVQPLTSGEVSASPTVQSEYWDYDGI
jgi:hypothetical protein